jgi:hypothetical protein
MSRKLTALLAALPSGLTLVLHGWLGSYTRPLADDFCSLYYAEHFGLLRSIWYWRLTWSGRYSAFAADWLEANLFGAYGLRFVPPLILILWLMCAAAAILLGLRAAGVTGGSVPLALALGAAFVSTTLALSPDVPQSLYWWNGMRSYALPLVLLCGYAALLQLWPSAQDNRVRPWLAALAGFGLFFVSGGLSETFAVAQFVLLLFLTGREYMSQQHAFGTRRALLLGGLLGAGAALLAVISAPGNFIRLTEAEVFVPPPGPAELTVISLQSYARLLSAILLTPHKLAALAGSILLAVWVGAGSQVEAEPRRILLWLSAGVLISLACYPPGVFGYHEPPPPRAETIAVLFLLAGVLYAAFLTGAALRSRLSGAASGLAAGLAIALLGLSAVVQAQSLQRAQAVYAEYARTWDALDAQILQAKAAGAESVTIPAVRNWAGLNVLNDNPRFWVNDCYTKYYGILVLGPAPD